MDACFGLLRSALSAEARLWHAFALHEVTLHGQRWSASNNDMGTFPGGTFQGCITVTATFPVDRLTSLLETGTLLDLCQHAPHTTVVCDLAKVNLLALRPMYMHRACSSSGITSKCVTMLNIVFANEQLVVCFCSCHGLGVCSPMDGTDVGAYRTSPFRGTHLAFFLRLLLQAQHEQEGARPSII